MTIHAPWRARMRDVEKGIMVAKCDEHHTRACSPAGPKTEYGVAMSLSFSRLQGLG